VKASDNSDMKELLSTLKRLTHALEKQGGQLPRVQETKAEKKPDLRPASAAAELPPLRQDFPTVQ
jgi:hypothetical protein